MKTIAIIFSIYCILVSSVYAKKSSRLELNTLFLLESLHRIDLNPQENCSYEGFVEKKNKENFDERLKQCINSLCVNEHKILNEQKKKNEDPKLREEAIKVFDNEFLPLLEEAKHLQRNLCNVISESFPKEEKKDDDIEKLLLAIKIINEDIEDDDFGYEFNDNEKERMKEIVSFKNYFSQARTPVSELIKKIMATYLKSSESTKKYIEHFFFNFDSSLTSEKLMQVFNDWNNHIVKIDFIELLIVLEIYQEPFMQNLKIKKISNKSNLCASTDSFLKENDFEESREAFIKYYNLAKEIDSEKVQKKGEMILSTLSQVIPETERGKFLESINIKFSVTEPLSSQKQFLKNYNKILQNRIQHIKDAPSKDGALIFLEQLSYQATDYPLFYSGSDARLIDQHDASYIGASSVVIANEMDETLAHEIGHVFIGRLDENKEKFPLTYKKFEEIALCLNSIYGDMGVTQGKQARRSYLDFLKSTTEEDFADLFGTYYDKVNQNDNNLACYELKAYQNFFTYIFEWIEESLYSNDALRLFMYKINLRDNLPNVCKELIDENLNPPNKTEEDSKYLKKCVHLFENES